MRSPRWHVCSRCRTARALKTVEPPEGWRVIPPGAVHSARDCAVYADLASYRDAMRVYAGSFDPLEGM